jgi:acyl dehydratase
MGRRYLEDFAVGQTFSSGRLRVDKEQIKAFAAVFDPQPFHLDEDAARDTIFRGLAASGWLTAALTMRLLVESELGPAGGIVGAGFDEFRWPRPCGLGTSSISKVRCWRCNRRGRVQIKCSSRCGQQR